MSMPLSKLHGVNGYADNGILSIYQRGTKTNPKYTVFLYYPGIHKKPIYIGQFVCVTPGDSAITTKGFRSLFGPVYIDGIHPIKELAETALAEVSAILSISYFKIKTNGTTFWQARFNPAVVPWANQYRSKYCITPRGKLTYTDTILEQDKQIKYHDSKEKLLAANTKELGI